MEEIDPLNVPAFKRKRSIAAKAKKTNPKITAKRKTRKSIEPQPELGDIPVNPILPSQELFQDEITRRSTNPKIREMKICGRCEGYFDKINVAIIDVTSPLRTGDQILLETSEGLFEEPITSMQINRKDVSLARSGSSIGVKVSLKPKVGGLIYKVTSP